MAIALVTTQTIIARNAGALYGVAVGNPLMNSLVLQATSISSDALLNQFYIQSVGTTSTTTVAATLIANLGITGATAIQQATDYIVAVLNANSPSFRGAAVNDLLDLFVGLTNDPNFGAAAIAYNAKVANAEAYASVAGNVANSNFVDPNLGQAFTLTTGVDTATANSFFASETYFNVDGKGPTINTGDKLTGTAGKTDNSLTITDLTATQGNANIPAGVQLTNIQNIVLNSSGNTSAGTGFSTVGFADVRSLTASTNGDGNDLYSAKNGENGTAINVVHNGFAVAGTQTVVGGTDVTAASKGGTIVVGSPGQGRVPLATEIATGAIVVNQYGTGAGAVGVFGGSSVTVNTTSSSNSGAIDIGNTTNNTVNTVSGIIANTTGNVTVNTAGTGAVTVFGGNDVVVNDKALKGAGAITVGDVTRVDASNQPTGNVTITEAAQFAYNGLAGSGNNNVASGAIGVFGGKNVSITTNAANAINIGNLGAVKENSLNATGTISVTNTGVVTAAGATGAMLITGGTDVTVSTTGADITIGRAAKATTDQVSNPTGNVTVTETMNGAGFARTVTIDGGKDVTVNAKGQAVAIGNSVASAPAGAVVVNQADIFTGNTNAVLNGTNAGNVTVRGGTDVTVNTTGGNVTVGGVIGGVNTVPSGAVKVTNTFGGVGADTVTVQGGTTVDITTTKTSGDITVGANSAALNAAGTALKDANLAPTGNVTIVDATTAGTATAYGTGNVNVNTNGATTVSIKGGDVDSITDIQSTLATGGSNAGKAIGTSTLKTVVIDQQQAQGSVDIKSDALTELTVTNQNRGNATDTITITNNTAGHALAITLGGNNVSLSSLGAQTKSNGLQIVDAKTTSVTVKDNGSASTAQAQIDVTKATAITFENTAAVNVKLDGVSSDIATVTLKGAGATTLVGTFGTGALSKAKTVDASAATGNVTAALQMTTTTDEVQAYKGGAGIDTITINSNASGWSSKATIDGGNGSADVLVADYAAAGTDVALGNAANVKGFEVLRVGISATGSYDASGFSTVQAGVITGNVALTGAATGLTLDVREDNSADTITVTGANYSATSTAMTVNLGTAAALQASQKAITTASGAITANGVEAFTINAVGQVITAGAATVGNTATVNGVASNGAGTLTIGGAASLVLTSNTGFTSINASGNTGSTVDVTAAKVSNSGATFTGGASKLVATGSNDSGTIKALVTLASSSATPILVGESVTVNINGTTFVYLAAATTTVAEAAGSIAALINAQTGTGTTNVVTGKGTTTQTGANVLTATAATASGGNIVLTNAAAFEVTTAETVVAATTTISDSLLGGQQVNVLTVTRGTVGASDNDTFTATVNGTVVNYVSVTGADSAAEVATGLAAAITAANLSGISSAVASGATVVLTSQLGQTNLVVASTTNEGGGTDNQSLASVASINMTTVDNLFVTGAGGGEYKAGLGGSFNTVTKKFGSGSETVNLSASTAKSDTLVLKEGATVTDNASKGGVTAFTVGSQSASDSVVFRNAADNGTTAKTIVANAVTGVVNTLNNAANMAAVFDSTGALNTKLANLTYSVSNGVITFGATGGNSLSQFTVNELINAAQLIVSSSTTGGKDKVAAFSHNGRSYVVASDSADTGAAGASTLGESTGAGSDTNNLVVELKDVASVKGFGATFGDATVVSSTVTNLTNATIDLAALATSSNLDYTGFAKATLSVAGTAAANTNTTKFANLAASSELVLNATGNVHLGLLETTQVGASGKNSLVVNATAASTLNRLTVNGDALVQFKNGAVALTVSELVDATNTMNTISIGAGTGTTTLTKVTGTALTTVSTTSATGDFVLGDAANVLAQNNVAFTLATGAGVDATIFTSGTGNTFTQGTATTSGTGAVTLTASGASNTITLSDGSNGITANGAGNTITVGTGTNTIVATGSDTVTKIAGHANVTTVTVGVNASVTVGTNDVVKVVSAVTGATADSFAKTTISFATDTSAAGNKIDFSGTDTVFTLLDASPASSQINVASATTLTEALNLAANYTLLVQDQGTAATDTANLLATLIGEVSWFQFGGDTYVVAMVNDTGAAVQQTGLDANDIVVKITGMVDLTGSTFAGESFTL